MEQLLLICLALGVFSGLHISVCENVEQQHDQGGEGNSHQQSSLVIVTYKIMEDVFELKNENRVMRDENRDLRKTVAELQNTILHLESQAKENERHAKEMKKRVDSADNRARGIENRLNSCESDLNNFNRSQNSLKTEVSSIWTTLDRQEKCQSGRGVGIHAYPQQSFPYTKTVQFNPPFRNVPALVYGFQLLDATDHTRYNSILVQLSKESFTIKMETWAASYYLWGVKINWMACPK